MDDANQKRIRLYLGFVILMTVTGFTLSMVFDPIVDKIQTHKANPAPATEAAPAK